MNNSQNNIENNSQNNVQYNNLNSTQYNNQNNMQYNNPNDMQNSTQYNNQNNIQANKKLSVANVLIIIYNLVSTITNSLDGYVSYMSIIILMVNMFLSITSLKKNGKTTSEVICLVLEIITAIIIVLGFI